MAHHAIEDGIHTIVATPHALGGTYPNPRQKIIKDVAALRERFLSEKIPLSLYPGSEVHICPDMAKRILAGEAAFLDENEHYILIEFPFQSIPPGFKNELFQLKLNRVTPIIAHPERNPMIHHEQGVLYDLVTMGCLIQVTSTSLTGGFGEDTMICAQKLLSLRLAHIIASDAHSAAQRPPSLSLAVEVAADILKDKGKALEMVDNRPKDILAGKPVDPPVAIRPEKKKRFFFF